MENRQSSPMPVSERFREINLNTQSNDIRPETRALKRAISAALARNKRRHNCTESGALLFLEPNCHELPTALVEDPVLDALDKVIWLVLLSRASSDDGVTLMPACGELARSANVAARQTASKSLSILRCRRWLTVCHTSWRKGGQRIGSAYALHGTPLPVADTFYLDPHYRTFVEELADQQKGRAKKTACEVLGQLRT